MRKEEETTDDINSVQANIRYRQNPSMIRKGFDFMRYKQLLLSWRLRSENFNEVHLFIFIHSPDSLEFGFHGV